MLVEKLFNLCCELEKAYKFDTPITTVLLRGKPGTELVRRATEHGHDLVIKMARRDEANGRFYGALAAQLMRTCPCPVWIVQPNLDCDSQQRRHSVRYRRIVAAVDAEIDGNERLALNTRILKLASALARLHAAELTVLHAWNPLAVDLLQKRMSDTALAAMLEHQQHAVEQLVSELITRGDLWASSPQILLPRGDAKLLIPACAKQIGADLVVMGTVSRTGLAGLLIGNTAETVLPQLDCSLLTVKPPRLNGSLPPRVIHRGSALSKETIP